MIYYIGGFPPPYGGVTIKNKNLLLALEEKLTIKPINLNDIKNGKVNELIRLIIALLNRNNKFVIGVAGKNTRKRFCALLYRINRRSMHKSIIILMGGTASYDIAADPAYSKYISNFKKVYVETNGMKETLDNAGLKNVDIYPNGRFRPTKEYNIIKNYNKPLKCVFFSLIQPQKGVDNIINAAKQLPNIEFHLYGHVDTNYEKEFESEISNVKNIKYHGVFSGSSEQVYEELRKYDVLLFPTKWKIEGVPGILVESKIAGLAAIVRNESYNSEIVSSSEGVLLQNNKDECLVQAILLLDKNRDLLNKYKTGNLASADFYYIEKYVEGITQQIRGGYAIKIFLRIRKPKYVYFSLISIAKGAEIVVKAAMKCHSCEFHFYGDIESSYYDDFLNEIKSLKNIHYHGLFKGATDEVYKELKKYDALLLPTKWFAEGVPGILVESKIAGIPAIVSNHNYNSEIVLNDVDGIVMNSIDEVSLSECINEINKPDVLCRLREGAKKSAQRFYIENYITKIINVLQ